MKNLSIALFLAALTFTACNKKTAQQKTPPPSTANEKTATGEKKAATLDDLKGKKIEAKQIPAEKLTDVKKARPADADGSYKSHYDSGSELHNSGDFNGAISEFTRSIEMNPQFPDAYNYRAMSRYKSGDKSGACADWQQAASLGDATANENYQRNCK